MIERTPGFRSGKWNVIHPIGEVFATKVRRKADAVEICRRLKAEFPELVDLDTEDSIRTFIAGLEPAHKVRFGELRHGDFSGKPVRNSLGLELPLTIDVAELYWLARGEASENWNQVLDKLSEPVEAAEGLIIDRRLLCAVAWNMYQLGETVETEVRLSNDHGFLRVEADFAVCRLAPQR